MNKTEFMRRVQDRLGLVDMAEADSATRSVLAALGDRITDDEAKDLASQLPKDLSEFVRQRIGPVQKMDVDTFIGRIQSDLDIDTWDHAANVATGVFSVLKDAVSEGEWEDVASHLPRELKEMFVTA
jgi:uncharacterized protein (DUF2267 family)